VTDVDENLELHLSIEEAAALESIWFGNDMPPLLAAPDEPGPATLDAGLRSLALRGLVSPSLSSPGELAPVIQQVFGALGNWTTRVVVDLAAGGAVSSSSWTTNGETATSHVLSDFGIHVLRVGPHADFSASMRSLGERLEESNAAGPVERQTPLDSLAAAQDGLVNGDGLDLGVAPAQEVEAFLSVLVEGSGVAPEQMELVWLDSEGWLAVGASITTEDSADETDTSQHDHELVRLSRPFSVPSALVTAGT
jgi:hypothetical protein